MITAPFVIAAIASNSKFYLIGFSIFALLFILLNILDGSHQGVKRKLSSIVGLACGLLAGFNAGDLPGTLLENALPYPSVILNYMGAIGFGFLVFAFITLLGIIVFKKTDKLPEEKQSKNRTVGGIIGAFIGIICVILMMITIKTFGTISGIFLANYAEQIESMEAKTPSQEKQIANNKVALFFLRFLENLNGAIIDVPGYAIADGLEPINEEKFELFDKAIQITNNEDAMKRFIEQPGTQSIIKHPSFESLVNDEDIKALAAKRKIHGLLTHPKVRAMMEDPDLQKRFEDYDVKSALDAALAPEEISAAEKNVPQDAPYETVNYNIQ